MTSSQSSASFYVLLPSNTNVDGNRTNSFRVRLPRKLEFGADWCVGLAVLVYPHTWPSLGTSVEQYVHVHWLTGKSVRIPLPSSTFRNPVELRDGLKRALGEGDEKLASETRTLQNTLSHLQARARQAAEIELNNKQLQKQQHDNENKEGERQVEEKVLLPYPPTTPFRPAAGAAAAIEQEQHEQQQQQQPKTDDEREQQLNNLYRKHLHALIQAELDEDTRATLEATKDLGLEAWIHAYRKVRNACRFDFDVERQRFQVEMNPKFIERLVLSEQLAYILGLNNGELVASDSGRVVEARFQPDMRGGISSFFVYTPGLIEPVIVGDVTAPLLRAVNIRGAPDEIVEEQFIAIQYHKLLVKELSEVFVEIRTASGTLMPFQYGTCQLTLHFKKMPYF